MKLYHIIDTKTVTAILCTYKGHILTTQRKDGRWSLPKGHRKIGETLIQAALRELAEETDIRPDPESMQYLGAMSHPRRGTPVHLYQTELPNPIIPILNEEHVDYRWCTYDDLLSMPKSEPIDITLATAYERYCDPA